MSDWRIDTKLQDNSQTVSISPNTKGYTAIKAPKGLTTPTLFQKGEVQRVLDSFGYPSTTYPQIQDVIDYVNAYACWVSAPYDSASALFGGVFVTKAGTIPFTKGLSSTAISDFSAISNEESLGTGDGSTTNFSTTLSMSDYYVNQSIDIEVDGVSITVTASDAEPEILTTDPNVGSGTYTRATGVVDFTFDTAPTSGEVITVTSTADLSSDAYFALISKSPQTDDLATLITANGSGEFILNMYRKDNDGVYVAWTDSPYTGSIVSGAKDGFGNVIYLETLLANNNYLVADVNTALTYSGLVPDTTSVAFDGGSRGDALAGSDIASAFSTYLQDPTTYNPKVIFACEDDSSVATAIETLSESYQTRSRFLLPTANDTATNLLTNTTSTKHSIDDRNINFFPLSWGIHKDLYNDNNFVCSNMGLIAKKYADSIQLSFGGLSPMYFDENGVGGQLGSSIVSLSNTASGTQWEDFDKAGMNPIRYYPGVGPVIVGDKTSSSTILTDYSYTIHSEIANYILENIEQQVLPAQIGKPNDTFHREQVRAKADLIVSQVSNYLEDYYIQCDESNNNADVRNLRKFVLTIGVIFEKNSQTIEFIFINSRSGLDIQEVVRKSA
jgi:hypothetical protein